ncbi:hypothetical protein KKA50_01130, partial [Patescibacteria group bacterium]|nr:hypothetical protein [Patescibacteria group bacterium]
EPRYISCTLSPQYLDILSRLIDKKKSEFKDISIITDPNIVTQYAMEPETLEEDHIWVVLEIPCSTDEKYMCNFFTEFSRALCEEYPETGCGEKRG